MFQIYTLVINIKKNTTIKVYFKKFSSQFTSKLIRLKVLYQNKNKNQKVSKHSYFINF